MPGREMRVRSAVECPGGKGVNAARALRSLGVPAGLLTLTDILDVPPRVNTTVRDRAGHSFRLLEPGPRLSAQQWHQVEAAVLKAARQVDQVVLSGSLPPGVPEDAYARIIRASGCAFLDTSGAALARGVKAAPFCVKPNREEAQALLGMTIRSRAAVRKALRSLAGYGIKRVLLSLGEDGLAGTDGQEYVRASVPCRRGSTVGCGDAALAGFLAGRRNGGSFAEALLFAAAAGAANVAVQVPGDILPGLVKQLMKKVVIERL